MNTFTQKGNAASKERKKAYKKVTMDRLKNRIFKLGNIALYSFQQSGQFAFQKMNKKAMFQIPTLT